MEWMDTIAMRGFRLNQWFTRRSPSRWMKDILKATPADVRHKVKTAIEHAVWAAAAGTEEFSRNTSPLLMWITRPELSATGTCSVCCPLDGRKEKPRKDFGVPYPAHPRCKCGIEPVSGQQKNPPLLTGLVSVLSGDRQRQSNRFAFPLPTFCRTATHL